MIQSSLHIPSKLRARVGLPQIASLLLLLIFLAQVSWFVAHVPLSEVEASYVEEGLLRLDGLTSANSPARSPLVAIMAGIPARLLGGEQHYMRLNHYRYVIRLPFIFCGVMLGASLWYVARRLYGNLGGYIALALYAFSPTMIIHSAQVNPEIVGAWGGFGLIFTAIAVAHTLYAPREVVLWNWRRMLMLGLSIAICLGAQFSLWVLLLPALGFMLWVGHVRRGAALVIFGAACVIGLVLLGAVYGYYLPGFWRALAGANWFEWLSRGAASQIGYGLVGAFLLRNGPGPLLLMVVTLVVFLVWKHTRYFGTAAPLIVAGVLLVCTLTLEHYAAGTFLVVALPFLILFTAGVSADMLQSRRAVLANALIVGVLIANAMLSLYGLLQLSQA